MFGVLVVAAPDGRIGYLRAFSGMLGGSWHVDGFAPPVFDDARARCVLAGGRGRARRARRAAIGLLDAEAAHARALAAMLAPARPRAVGRLRDRHPARTRPRVTQRARLGAAARTRSIRRAAAMPPSAGASTPRIAIELARRRARVRAIDAELAAIDQARTERSRELLRAIHDTYVIANARGERRPLRALFATESPPGGAGDCAAPKLLALRVSRTACVRSRSPRCGGATPPATGGRHEGVCYPACRGKCGPILAHMLRRARRRAAAGASAPTRSPPTSRASCSRTRWLAVVAKPAGLLSVPGRSGQLRDSVATRLRRALRRRARRAPARSRHARACCSSRRTKRPTPRSSARSRAARSTSATSRSSTACVAGDRGTIELPLRVDLDDRPRQIVDPIHGKPALTEWRVVARTADTHARRAHAAHRPHASAARPRRARARARRADRRRSALRPRRPAHAAARRGARVRPSAHRGRIALELRRRSDVDRRRQASGGVSAIALS